MRPALLQAYRETSYKVGDAVVRIGQRSPALDRFLFSQGGRQAVFITAYNPRSRLMPPGWNFRMQVRLIEMLRRHRIFVASGQWRRWSEAHQVVLGDQRPMLRLALRFRQNGIVLARLRQPARLLLTFHTANARLS